MGLRERLSRTSLPPASDAGTPSAPASTAAERNRRAPAYQQIKLTLQRQLVERIDAVRLTIVDSPAGRLQIRELLEQLILEENPPLSQEERRQLVDELEHDTFGLGPIEPFMHDPAVDDILVNRCDEVYVERFGRLERTSARFRDDAHLLQVIERIVSRAGRRIDESSPMVDARLPDGSRINAIIPPLAVDGPALSIRRLKQRPLAMEDLLRFGSLNAATASLLEAAVTSKRNILISGGSGSGKTTLLNSLVRHISASERIVSIEDTVELRLEGQHVIRLETRPPNIEAQGEITQRDLVRNALRMRPDRILIGEVRGAEAFDMLQAMNTGHKGSLTTIHANSPRDALARLEMMILMAGTNLTSEAMRRQISSAIDIIIQLHRFPDGVRRVISVCEIDGMDESVIKLQELVKFQSRAGSPEHPGHGEFLTTGVMPAFVEELKRAGLQLPALFAHSAADAGRLAHVDSRGTR